jgi:hypothetical protein
MAEGSEAGTENAARGELRIVGPVGDRAFRDRSILRWANAESSPAQDG